MGQTKKRKIEPRQWRFIEEYVVDFNGAQAAIRAGYSKHTAKEQATRLLTKAHVKAEIEKRKKAIAAKCEVTTERIVEEYAHLAFLDPSQCYDENDNLRPITQMPEAVRRALTGFDLEVKSEGDGRAHVRKIRFADKKGALDSLSRIQGLFQDKLQITGADHLAEDLEAARRRRLAEKARAKK